MSWDEMLLLLWKKLNSLFYSQMHGYDMSVMNMTHGPPLPPTMEPNTHHPDSTDSYVTYLESDDSMQGSP